MRLITLVLTLWLTASAAASAQTATPDSENGRYSFSAVADGVLRLDSRTGQVSQCSRSDAGWAIFGYVTGRSNVSGRGAGFDILGKRPRPAADCMNALPH